MPSPKAKAKAGKQRETSKRPHHESPVPSSDDGVTFIESKPITARGKLTMYPVLSTRVCTSVN